MKILVCGGAGYIGSHMVKMLAKYGHQPVTFDNLSTGHRHAVKWGEFQQGDLLVSDDLKSLFDDHRFDAVMHFSARSLVGESMQNPGLYYQNNVLGTYNLLEQMRNSGITRFIFSSSAAVYGNPVQSLIDEQHPLQPINPYGRSKKMVEEILADYNKAYGLSSVSLRYFNAAGADAEGDLGEEHDPETHLIPNILRAAAGKGPELKLFGTDYDTHDGTCVRDYVHVQDLCMAHLQALDFLMNNNGAHVFNLGNGNGFSVLEVIKAAVVVVGKEVPFEVMDRRAGDPAVLVADASKAKMDLGWSPKYDQIEEIIDTAWGWIGA